MVMPTGVAATGPERGIACFVFLKVSEMKISIEKA